LCPQLRLERYFRATRKLPSTYWTGLIKNANLYYWPDGSVVNNGATSNSNPYAHFWYNFQDRLARYPTYTYTLAHSSYRYGRYSGAWGWYPSARAAARADLGGPPVALTAFDIEAAALDLVLRCR
jgi:hypothetical protein